MTSYRLSVIDDVRRVGADMSVSAGLRRASRVLGIVLLLILLTQCEQQGYPYYLGFQSIDSLIIRYYWAETAGRDLDTRTAIIIPQRDVDVGWSRSPSDGDYLEWGGDNTGVGYEAVRIDFEQLGADFPDTEQLVIRMRAFWYGSRGSGDMNVEFTGYAGGTMVKEGYNWRNSGGYEERSIVVSRNVEQSGSADLNGEELGTAVYTFASKQLEIRPPELATSAIEDRSGSESTAGASNCK